MEVRRRRNALAQTLASRRLPEGVAEPGERVPDALAPEVMPFIRAADEVEPLNPRVAFLCEFITTLPTLDGTDNVAYRFTDQLIEEDTSILLSWDLGIFLRCSQWCLGCSSGSYSMFVLFSFRVMIH